MSRITQAHPWMSVEELKALLKRTNDRRTAQKALVVINAALQPCLAKDIAVRVGVAKQTVHNWMSVYNRFGPEKLFDNKPRKPSENLLTEEEETLFYGAVYSMGGHRSNRHRKANKEGFRRGFGV